MTEAIVVALITGSVTLVGTVLSNVLNHSKTMYRIDILEKKVEKHNNFIERLYIAEGKICALEDRQKELDADLDAVRGKV